MHLDCDRMLKYIFIFISGVQSEAVLKTSFTYKFTAFQSSDVTVPKRIDPVPNYVLHVILKVLQENIVRATYETSASLADR